MKQVQAFGVIAAGLLMAACLAGLSSPQAMAQTAHGSHGGHGTQPSQSPYAGQQDRDIKSLSAQDQQQLRAGQGWGLARSAELNGVPGPAHLLELANEIGLSAEQRQAIGALFAQMQQRAIELGNEFISRERAIDEYFRQRVFSEEKLKALVSESARALADLRYLHLSYHDQMMKIVTPAQVEKYNLLRGYAATSSDPCASVPSGHDPVMYRKHMGCTP